MSDCQPVVGAVVGSSLITYSTVCPVVPALVTVFTVMVVVEIEDVFSTGAPLTAAPSPLAIAPIVTVPVGVMAAGAVQINNAVNKINELSGKNHDGINALITEVLHFKTE